jgi:hypothetical protein
MESKLVSAINFFLDNLDDDDLRDNLEELADDPCEWVVCNLANEIYDTNDSLGMIIWRYGFENIDFDYIRDIYLIKLKQYDDNANANANENEDEEGEE